MARDIFIRNVMFYGEAGFERLQRASVAIVGMGGVGSYAAEALVRAGIGRMRIIDCDVIKASDVNRQLLALSTNLDTPKVAAAQERLLSINPELQLDARQAFFHFDTANDLVTQDLDFVVDAIDSLNPKAALIQHCAEHGIPILSALGASSRRDPFAVRIATLSQTTGCPLARALRRHLRSKKVAADPPVLYSQEPSVRAHETEDVRQAPESVGAYSRGRKRRALPSIATLPGIVGLMAANYVLFELLKDCQGTDAAGPASLP
jgi:tRNA threonylcarbamoyladenosine dehydratase